MKDTSLYFLLILLIILILCSLFFSLSETGLMSLNRYRIQHLARKQHRAAKRVNQLLLRPDRLLGAILIGSTFANILASAVATIIAQRLFGDFGVMLSTVFFALVILIFAEIMPKTLAVLHPEQVSFVISLSLKFFLKGLYPLVWSANYIVNGILKIFGIQVNQRDVDALSREELRAILLASGGRISPRHQGMLLGILDLEKVTVNDVMVPSNEIVSIDLNEEWSTVLQQLKNAQRMHILVYRESLDQLEGWLHLRKIVDLLIENQLNKETILKQLDEICFIPEGTLLGVQLLNFQSLKYRMGLVVDEYGTVQGLVTLEDILEEIVGEFSTDLEVHDKKIRLWPDGSYLVSGSISVRDLNRSMGWELPLTGPKTLSGLIVEHLESLPRLGVGLRLAGYPIEVVAVKNKRVDVARIMPNLRKISGFSLFELLIVMAVVMILSLLSVSGWQHFSRVDRESMAVQKIAAAIRYARVKAIQDGEPVIFCKSSDHLHCGGQWRDGQLVVSASGKIFRTLEALPSGDRLVWRSSFGRNDALEFLPIGYAAQQGRFYYYSTHQASIRELVINQTGRVRLEETAISPC